VLIKWWFKRNGRRKFAEPLMCWSVSPFLLVSEMPPSWIHLTISLLNFPLLALLWYSPLL